MQGQQKKNTAQQVLNLKTRKNWHRIHLGLLGQFWLEQDSINEKKFTVEFFVVEKVVDFGDLITIADKLIKQENWPFHKSFQNM